MNTRRRYFIRKRRAFPNRLRVLRAERRMTQWELANRGRMSQPRLSQIENEYIEPTEQEQKRLARGLSVSVAEAFPQAVQEAVAS